MAHLAFFYLSVVLISYALRLIYRTALTQYEIWKNTSSLSGQAEPGITTDFQQSKRKIIYCPTALGLANPTSFLNNMWTWSGSSADIFLMQLLEELSIGSAWWQEHGAKSIALLKVVGKALAGMTAEPPQAFPPALDACCSALGPHAASSLRKEGQDPALLRLEKETNQYPDWCSQSAAATRLPLISWRSLVRSQRCKGLSASLCHSWATTSFGRPQGHHVIMASRQAHLVNHPGMRSVLFLAETLPISPRQKTVPGCDAWPS